MRVRIIKPILHDNIPVFKVGETVSGILIPETIEDNYAWAGSGYFVVQKIHPKYGLQEYALQPGYFDQPWYLRFMDWLGTKGYVK